MQALLSMQLKINEGQKIEEDDNFDSGQGRPSKEISSCWSLQQRYFSFICSLLLPVFQHFQPISYLHKILFDNIPLFYRFFFLASSIDNLWLSIILITISLVIDRYINCYSQAFTISTPFAHLINISNVENFKTILRIYYQYN